MAELTDINGVGPARSDSLNEAGYTSVEEVADADPDQLAEDADITDDKAVDFVVQSENLVAAEDANVEERDPVTQEIEEAIEGDEEEESESLTEEEVEEVVEEAAVPEVEDDADDSEPDEESVYSFTLEPETALQHDTLFAAVMRGKETMLQANRTNTEVFDSLLDQMRSSDVDDTIELEADADGLNGLHNHVRKLVTFYQGNNLIDHMNALKAVQTEINEVREENLF